MKTFSISGNIWEAADILALRKRLKLTQLQLGRLLLVTDGAVSRWEHGQRVPEPGNMVALDRVAEEGGDG